MAGPPPPESRSWRLSAGPPLGAGRAAVSESTRRRLAFPCSSVSGSQGSRGALGAPPLRPSAEARGDMLPARLPAVKNFFPSSRKFFSIDPLNISLEKPGNRLCVSLPEKRSSNIILTWPYERKTQFCEILKKVWATPKKHAIRLF